MACSSILAHPHSLFPHHMPVDEPADVIFPYKATLGSLQFGALGTRHDIPYVLSTVIKSRLSMPLVRKNLAVIRILTYLKGTATLGLRFVASSTLSLLTVYTYADFAMDLDGRKSRTALFVLFLNRTLVAWGSRKQPSCYSLTTEAEYMSIVSAIKEVIWLHRLLNNSGLPQAGLIILFPDNQSDFRLVHNHEYHHRTKHIHIQYHALRKAHECGVAWYECASDDD